MNRNQTIDIVKGFGIILIVLGHSGFPYTDVLYLFHVAIFIMASGYLYNTENSSSIKKSLAYSLKKLKGLYIPYVFWNIAFLSLTNLFIKINIYTDNKDFLTNKVGEYESVFSYINVFDWTKDVFKIVMFSGTQQLLGAAWFLRVLFFVAVIYLVLEYISKKISKKYYQYFLGVFCLILLFFGFFLQKRGLVLKLSIPTVLSSVLLYFMGSRLKFIKTFKWMNLPLFLASVVCIYVLSLNGKISLNENVYPNPLFLLVASLAGWIIIYLIAEFISKYKASKLITFIGSNSISILLLHFLSFKAVSLIIVKIYNMPYYELASFPIIKNDSYWWIAYTIAGVLIPVLLAVSISKVIKIINDLLAKKNRAH